MPHLAACGLRQGSGGCLSDQKTPINPFRYGREVELLVDRADEVARIVRIGENCGTLFFIGPRRYGKTSILRAADDALTKSGVVVLRYDAEAFENIGLLAVALMTGAGNTQVPLLTAVLNGIERLAAADQRKAEVGLNECQQVVSEAGEKTER